MSYGGGCGMPPLRGGVCCVYDGYKRDYGESGSNFARLYAISLPSILSWALTFWIRIW
jgi:hypothetical protein